MWGCSRPGSFPWRRLSSACALHSAQCSYVVFLAWLQTKHFNGARSLDFSWEGKVTACSACGVDSLSTAQEWAATQPARGRLQKNLPSMNQNIFFLRNSSYFYPMQPLGKLNVSFLKKFYINVSISKFSLSETKNNKFL